LTLNRFVVLCEGATVARIKCMARPTEYGTRMNGKLLIRLPVDQKEALERHVRAMGGNPTARPGVSKFIRSLIENALRSTK